MPKYNAQHNLTMDQVRRLIETAGDLAPFLIEALQKITHGLSVGGAQEAARAARSAGGGEEAQAAAAPGSMHHPRLNQHHRAILDHATEIMTQAIQLCAATDRDYAPEGQETPQNQPQETRSGPQAGNQPGAAQGGPQGQPGASPEQRTAVSDQARAAQAAGQESVARAGGEQETMPEASTQAGGAVPGAHPGNPQDPGKAQPGSVPNHPESGQQREDPAKQNPPEAGRTGRKK